MQTMCIVLNCSDLLWFGTVGWVCGAVARKGRREGRKAAAERKERSDAFLG